MAREPGGDLPRERTIAERRERVPVVIEDRHRVHLNGLRACVEYKAVQGIEAEPDARRQGCCGLSGRGQEQHHHKSESPYSNPPSSCWLLAKGGWSASRNSHPGVNC